MLYKSNNKMLFIEITWTLLFMIMDFFALLSRFCYMFMLVIDKSWIGALRRNLAYGSVNTYCYILCSMQQK